MRFKPVPEPPADLEFVATVQAAVPADPEAVDDCCARLVDRTSLRSRDEASTWLTFLRALELATEGPSGFGRVDREPDPDRLRSSFRERVYGAERVLEILADADGALTADAVYERFHDGIPEYERERSGDDLEAVWGERVRRILEWAVLLDLAGEAADGYLLEFE